MAEYTENYNLEKQEGNDNVDISGINNNFDIIDAEIKNAQDRANQAFQSASEGKQKIATAITGKGVPTSSSDTFSTMADNIEAIETDPSIGTTNAVPADVLAPKKVVSQGQLFEGTMPNRGPTAAETINLAEQNQEYTIASGFHTGLRKIKAVIAGLVASVIKYGSTVGGVEGNFTGDANATAAQMLSGVIAYVKGNKITGTIPSKVAQTFTPSTTNQTIAVGQYLSGNQVIQGSSNLVPENIKEGVNIFGKIGTLVEDLYSISDDDILLALPIHREFADSNVFHRVKEFKIGLKGNIRLKFVLGSSSTTYSSRQELVFLRNEVEFNRIVRTGSGVSSYSEDIFVNRGDIISLLIAKTNTGSGRVLIENLFVYATVGNEVLID